jgi:hypothetical protein
MRTGLFVVAATGLGLASTTSTAQTLAANPGDANNGGSAGWAIFFDVEALSAPVTIHQMTTASTAGAGQPFAIEIFTREGTSLGGPASQGPGSSPAGWTSLGTANAVQGQVASQTSDPIQIPAIHIPAGHTVGVAVLFTGAGPRYYGTSSPPYGVYWDSNLRLTTGDSRSQPFTPSGSFFSSRELVGSLTYFTGSPCYADCDANETLNVDDFICFINEFAAAQSLPPSQQMNHYANCTGATTEPMLTVDDFICFINEFAQGCP